MTSIEQTLSNGQLVDGKYSVIFFIKKGTYAETYRVKDKDNKIKLLKLFNHSKLHYTQFSQAGEVLEIEILKKISHPNIVKMSSCGSLILDKEKYSYAIFDFISGETLAEKIKREHSVSHFNAKNIISGVLNGLAYLHNQSEPIIHNDITDLNIMLDLSGNIPIPKIIDFGYARYLSQTNSEFHKDGLNPFFSANETFRNQFSIQSDIFSVGVLYYYLLIGTIPWFIKLSKFKSATIKIEDAILEERGKPLKFEDSDLKLNEHIKNIIKKALQNNAVNRFKNLSEFIRALNGELQVETTTTNEESIKPKLIKKEVKKGKGFDAIAGMQKLKYILQLDVIDALNEREKYAEYGLTIPNGMLLYGPPGCGKTFFAEKFAEEIGFNFYQIKPSDIQSKWVNATQENVKHLFDEARENAPSIIFIDEMDALVPNRNNDRVSHSNTSAVNEFLAQMNNIGDDGVFIIAATNIPSSIDPAILRSGRLDKHIFIPPPDFEARELMFKIYLEKRPIDPDVDFAELAKKTENYVSSDIKFLCDEASRTALGSDSKITKEILFNTIKSNKPSIPLIELNSYKEFNIK